MQPLSQTASASPFKIPADNSYDDPIILSDTDTDTDMDSVTEVMPGRGEAVDSSKKNDGLTAPHSLPRGTGGPIHGLALLSPTHAAANNHHDESRSSTTLDQSYATSLNSDLNAISYAVFCLKKKKKKKQKQNLNLFGKLVLQLQA